MWVAYGSVALGLVWLCRVRVSFHLSRLGREMRVRWDGCVVCSWQHVLSVLEAEWGPGSPSARRAVVQRDEAAALHQDARSAIYR